MNRSYLAAHKVAVYKDQEAKDAGIPLKVITRIPYPTHGFDNYTYNGVMYPGYFDAYGHDACIILTLPLQ